MVSHQVTVSESGTGSIDRLQKFALAEGSGYSYRHLAAYEDHGPDADPLDFLSDGGLDEQLRRSPSLALVLDGLQELSFTRRSELVGRMLNWSKANSNLPVAVYWTLQGVLPDDEEVSEALKDVLPLVRSYETAGDQQN